MSLDESVSLDSNGKMEMFGNLGPGYLEAQIEASSQGYIIQGRLDDMPFRQTIEWNLAP